MTRISKNFTISTIFSSNSTGLARIGCDREIFTEKIRVEIICSSFCKDARYDREHEKKREVDFFHILKEVKPYEFYEDSIGEYDEYSGKKCIEQYPLASVSSLFIAS